MADDLVEAARKERVVMENALAVISSIDAAGNFVKVSPASLSMFGYAPEELIGCPYWQIVSTDIWKRAQAAIGDLQTSIAAESLFETSITKKTGEQQTALWAVRWSESEHSMFCVINDITDRKRAEEALIASRCGCGP